MAIVTDLEKVNWKVTDIMKKHYGESLAKIILYGSYARGDFHEESDVDYVVLLDRENVSPFMEVTTTVSDRNDYYLETFIHISAVVVSHSQYLTSNRPFYKEVRKDGKVIYERGLVPSFA
ncbi:nucleotidyltransferase domain-containing protein [Spirosoma montaniterrae]|uniref:Polymerase beta nucleotidyltransferase domain-containing protein n=1 Tax=Spirosoma montaniterrae TaxID=1178516 RepID=A0A1P9X367_9BACT|nr:nucleotidyltransferase domain-containing protein [Spirosoma montaniterrae]AQG82053.1 hypothetical protein AWR27_23810 [Spirosoma montaniterrae]